MDDDNPQTTTQRSEPWSEQKPHLEFGFNEAKKLYNTGGPQYYQGNTVAGLSDPSQAAIDGFTQRAINGSPLKQGAQDLAQKTMNGDFLSQGNPHFQQMLSNMTKGATQQFNESVMPGIASQFSASGRYGSGAHQDVAGKAVRDFGDSLSSTAGQLAYQNYGDERTKQMQAMQLSGDLANQDYADLEKLAGAGSALDQYNQSVLNSDIDRWNFSQNQPANEIAQFMGLVNGGYGSTNTVTQPGQNNSLGQLAGAGVSIASLFM